jgi:Domain of unknown function (DUF5916)
MRNWALALLLLPAAARAQAPAQNRTIHIVRTPRPLTIEALLNGNPPDAARIDDFRQNRPGDGDSISEKTTAYLAYDRENIYIGFVCQAPPGELRARVSRREELFPDDQVGVNLDTFSDRRRTFFFYVNAHGIQLDGLYTEGQGDDLNFDTVWKSEARVTPDGFVALLTIPFKSLRFPASGSQTWGIALARQIPRKNETGWWPYVDRKVSGFANQLGRLEGLEEISPGRNLQFTPYGFVAGSSFLDQPEESPASYRRENTLRSGLDAKAVLRDAFTLDLSLNPDFSQVESDEPQVTVNQRFEVFFPEKRPFFLENGAFFHTPENLFFTRRIADPLFGARLTGKARGWALGVLAIDDRAPDDDGVVQTASIGVARVQREFGNQSAIGALVTSRDRGPNFNRVASLDLRLRFSPHWTFDAQSTRTYTRDEDGRRAGVGWAGSLTHGGERLFARTEYRDRSPDFHTDLGFTPRVDQREVRQFAHYRWKPNGTTLVAHGPFSSGTLLWNSAGALQDWHADAGWNFELKGTTFAEAFHAESFERFEGRGFRKRSTNVHLFSERFRAIGLRAGFHRGTAINYDPVEGRPAFAAGSAGGRASLLLRPWKRGRIEETYFYTRLGGNAPVFNNHILRSKISWQFSREFSLRLILDYNAVLANPLLSSQERAKKFTGDVLFTYLLRPGTALYVGYVDRYENLLLEQGATEARRVRDPFRATGRQFFVKASYLFRF